MCLGGVRYSFVSRLVVDWYLVELRACSRFCFCHYGSRARVVIQLIQFLVGAWSGKGGAHSSIPQRFEKNTAPLMLPSLGPDRPRAGQPRGARSLRARLSRRSGSDAIKAPANEPPAGLRPQSGCLENGSRIVYRNVYFVRDHGFSL